LRIAVTGAAGYIGGHLCAELLARGHEVWAADRAFPPGGVQCSYFSEFGLTDSAYRAQWLQWAKPDVVVHLAALYGRVWGEADLIETAAQNAGVTAALARDTAKAGARLVHVSSSEVYGAAAGQPGAMLAPLNMYGLTKKWGEEAARLYCPDGLVIARLNMPYGPPVTDPERGTSPPHSGRVGPHGYNMLHTFLWQAANGLPITVHRGAERSMTWIGDAVAGLAQLAETDGLSWPAWDVCRDDDYRSVADIAALAVKLAGSQSEVREVEMPEGITPRKRLGSSPLRHLGWEPKVSLEDGMAMSLPHFARYDAGGVFR
jgi:nucleoside-diphosphate-sugar epimerase